VKVWANGSFPWCGLVIDGTRQVPSSGADLAMKNSVGGNLAEAQMYQALASKGSA
jgi:hypothetical protein